MTIRLTLSPDSINSAIAELEEHKKRVARIPKATILQLLELGAAHLARTIPVRDGALKSAIRTAYDDEAQAGYLYIDDDVAPHGVFVEYGTGVVGQSGAKNLNRPEGWAFNSGSTIRILGDGRLGWTYEKDGRVYSTHGQQSNPFFYNTYKHLQAEVKKAVKSAL